MSIAENRARVARAFCAALALCAASAGARALSPEEQRIASYVDAHTGEALRLLEKVVNTESATANVSGGKRAALLIYRLTR